MGKADSRRPSSRASTRAGWRAVYVDDQYLLEAGLGRDDQVRVWPSRGLMPFELELVTPTAREAAAIEERISQTTRRLTDPPPRSS